MEDADKIINDTEIKPKLNVIINPDKAIPKFVSAVNFTRTKQGGVVMTFLGEGPNSSDKVLVETIFVEEDHAREIVKVLEQTINKKI
jgi:hypothetical protein